MWWALFKTRAEILPAAAAGNAMVIRKQPSGALPTIGAVPPFIKSGISAESRLFSWSQLRNTMMP
jgi:hypothetical protein